MRVRSSDGHVFAGHLADGDDAFHRGGVRQLRHSGDDVADGVQAGLVGFLIRADVNVSALHLRARGFQTQAAGHGGAPDGDEHAVGGERLHGAGLIAEGHGGAGSGRGDRFDFRAK